MKALFFIFLFLAVSLSAGAQTLQELIVEYEAYCNQTVLDTIQQDGLISYEATNGKDTVWLKPNCSKYKQADDRWDCITADGLILHRGGFDLFAEEDETERVHRPHVCRCKRRRIVPFSEHFWNWVKTRKTK